MLRRFFVRQDTINFMLSERFALLILKETDDKNGRSGGWVRHKFNQAGI